MKPVEIEFLMKDLLSPGLDKSRLKVEELLAVARKTCDALDAKIGQQRKVIEGVVSALDGMERKLDGIGPGPELDELTADIAGCRKALTDELAVLDDLERQHEQTRRTVESLDSEYRDLSSTVRMTVEDAKDALSAQDNAEAGSRRLSARLRELQDSMARMRIAGQQDTEEYRNMAAEAASLSDTIADLRTQTKILSDDDANLQGFISGINGASGAITVATGAISLFASENENLAKIQTRVQSVMAVTMGLQQVFNTLNKDSAFRLVTVTRAKNLLTAATARLATALRISDTAAKAMIGTLTLGLSVVVTALIYAWDKYADSQQKAVEKAKELAEIEAGARAERIKTRFELDSLRESLRNYTGSQEEERRKVDELNSKYGEAFGYYDTVSQWYDTLTRKSEQYIQTLFLQAKMQALVNKAVATDEEIAGIEAGGVEAYRNFWTLGGGLHKKLWGYDPAEVNYDNALRAARAKKQSYLDEAAELNRQIEEIKKSADIGGHSKPTSPTTSSPWTGTAALSDELLAQQRRNQQAEIDLMADGAEKRRKQIRYDYDTEIAEIDALEQKWRDQQKGNLDAQQRQALEAARALASARMENGEEEIAAEEAQARQERLEAARKSWQQYYVEYGSYEEKRKALAEQYAERIAEAETAGDKASLQRQLDDQLRSLDFSEFKASIDFADVFGNLELQSTESLAVLRGKLKDYINAAAGELRPQDLRELQEAVERIEFRIDTRRPFQALKTDLQSYREAQKEVAHAQEALNIVMDGGEIITEIYEDETGNLVRVLLTQTQAERNLASAQARRNEAQQALAKSATAVGSKMHEIGDAVNQTMGTLEDDFGIKLSEDIKNVVDGFGEMTEGVTGFGEALASGNVAGAIGSAVQTLGGLVKTVGSAFGADWGGQKSTARYEAAKAEYESYMSVLDKVIDKQLELVATMTSTDYLNASNSYEYAKGLVQKQADAARNLGVQYLNSGSSKGFLGIGSSASAGTKQREGISDDAWREYNALKANTEMLRQLGLSASTLAEAAGDRMTGLFSLSAEQLNYIMQDAPTFWAQLHEDTRTYLEQIIECGDAWKEIQDARNESLTGMSFDDFYSNWKSRIRDMDSDAKDLAEDIEGYFRNAFLGNLLDEKYKSQVKALYERWADMTESDGKITDAEIESLRLERDALAQQMVDERNRMAEAFGWTSDSGTTQSGKAGGFAAMSQDQGTKLEGMFTSGLMHWASMDQHSEDVAERMGETSDVLREIRDNTGSCKESLSDIKTGMDRILRDGVKIQ